ncbi:SDR family oxidoreductase [Frigoriflavimonas asaccharolytica]|uniref:NAD(P)-dependent dehydrogenase (Short-subunit alcohol dehydrogenase family) n=1 Tax=Frigoriflavimonas asaccharolytica TaxID=2735899 RepID=A0A8J8GAM0_9FLAO|nr:SDR family oxidoreductase [Frigoriflavimonas asaccharolytica]NRS92122.1 NAD(P)-dependent dehydrogenase (short-subunit alcohol dehydrogenase family) [Frigoriflavimonas asaccharolytica]
MKKTIFITGASSGLGKATALLFAKNDWNVIATMRKPENETDLTDVENVTLLPLDVTNAQQINDTIEKALKISKIDVVFNNAGYGLAGPFEGATHEQISNQINTNLVGVMHVIQKFLPHFRENKAGTFITTTSIGGLVTLPFNSVYHATKWALEGFSESLAFELKEFGINVKTVSPGGIATDFAGRSLVMTQHPAYQEQMNKVLSVFMDPERAKDYSTAEQIAEVVYEAATDGKSTLRYVAGADAKAMYAQRLEVGEEVFRQGIEHTFYSK